MNELENILDTTQTIHGALTDIAGSMGIVVITEEQTRVATENITSILETLVVEANYVSEK